uniref:PAP2_C domain-containing protein n=1 Tax=Ascaris lumbricoides TaxID=6252 RepID=A0A0M3HI00_ASCLU
MLCGDLLFSGHTISMVISPLTIGYYLPHSHKSLRFAMASRSLQVCTMGINMDRNDMYGG